MRFCHTLVLLLVMSIPLNAQDHRNHEAPPFFERSSLPVDHHVPFSPSRDHAMHTEHAMHEMKHSMYGTYSINRDASGTSWMPDSSPETGFDFMHDEWMFMIFGFSYTIFDKQTGPRGGKQFFDENMLMATTQRDLSTYTFALRTMLSLEPATIGSCGYPLLLQTGETCNGVTPLINRQHPHDLVMELGVVNTFRFTEHDSLFLYFALPGEPALGPPVYFMRFSGEYNPETPIAHHWTDSTHVQFGVLTVGFVHDGCKVEVSSFTGREPDQFRFDFDKPRFDSYSFRISCNPTPNLALQFSYGFLKSPEQLRPELDIARTTCSILYNKAFDDSNVQLAAIFGLNDEKPGDKLPALILEGTLELHKTHLFFTRYETVNKNDLFIAPDPLAHHIFNVQKLTMGYVYEFLHFDHLKWGIGGMWDIPLIPPAIKNRYGDAFGYMVFLQLTII